MEGWSDRRSPIAVFQNTRTTDRSSLQISIYGNARGDLDNIAGAILDALVQSGVLKNDGLKNIPKLILEWQPSKHPHAEIVIYPIAIPENAPCQGRSRPQTFKGVAIE